MNSAQRALEIYSRLLNDEELSSVELAKYYGVSRKSIENSFKTINSFLKEPLVKYNKSSKKWSLTQKNTLPLSKEEVVTLNIIKQAAKERGESFYKDTTKLLSKFKDSLYNSIYNHIDTENIDNIKEELAIVNSAVINRQFLSLKYKDKNRITKPLKLANFDGYWYLIVQDSDSRIKTFYFKEISNIKPLNKYFKVDNIDLEKKLNNAINAYFTTDVTPYEIKLYITKEIAHLFKRKPISKSQRELNSYDDGSLEIAITITHDMEIIPTLQQYIPYIFIIEDDTHSKRVAKKLKENLKKYLEEI